MKTQKAIFAIKRIKKHTHFRVSIASYERLTAFLFDCIYSIISYPTKVQGYLLNSKYIVYI